MKKLSLLLLSALLLAGCVGHKKYVGRTGNYYNTFWCICDGRPCKLVDECFVFEFTVRENNGEYTVEGTIDPTKGKLKSWSTFQTKDTRFSLLLIGYDNIIFDNLPISYRPNISRKMKFSKKFIPEKKPAAIGVDWQYSVRG